MLIPAHYCWCAIAFLSISTNVIVEQCKFIHAYPKIAFSGTKITKSQYTASFSGTHRQTYPHIHEIILATRFYRKITRQSFTVYLPYRFCTAENAICWSCLTKHQSNNLTTVLQLSEFMQVSPFSSMVTKDHSSWYAFLNVWKHPLFSGEFYSCANNRLSHAFPHTWNSFFKWCPVFKDLFNFQLCRCNVLFRKLPGANPRISVFHECAMLWWSTNPVQKLWLWLLLGKIRKAVLLLLLWVFFLRKAKSRTYPKLSVFPERLTSFHDFQERIRPSHNSRRVCKCMQLLQGITYIITCVGMAWWGKSCACWPRQWSGQG